MTPTDLVPLNVIDPDAAHREWRRQFEWHLDQVPPLLDTMSELSSTFLRAQSYEARVTGGGYVDNVHVTEKGAGADATDLWTWVVSYTRAVHAWIRFEIDPDDRPAIADDPRTWNAGRPRPDADPLTARGTALVTIGWLIDHAHLIEPIHELDEHRYTMFALIRRLRGRHRGTHTARRARPRLCGVCGECAVLIDWIDGPNGSPKPIRVGRCKICGQTYDTPAEPS